MTGFNQIERSHRTAIYIRISTSQQQTDSQETELKEFALRNGLNFNEKTDIFRFIIVLIDFVEWSYNYKNYQPDISAGLIGEDEKEKK